MAQVEILQVQDRRGMRQFLDLPYQLYRGDPYWVPPLRVAQKELFDREHHPFYQNADTEFFLARRDGRVVGRIAAILDHNHNRFQNEQAGFFGFFECINDPGAATGLLAIARDWVLSHGATLIRGPVNPSTNYVCGMLVEGFDSHPAIMMTYNPPYYAALMDGIGLRKAKDLVAYAGNVPELATDKAERAAARALRASGIRVRPIRTKAFHEDVERIWDVYNSAWSRNWGFVPMTREEFLFSAKEMKQILVPEMILLGEIGDRVIGFALALPDINDALRRANGRLFPFGLLKILYYGRLATNIRVIALGVVEEFRTAGVAAAFYATLIRNARRRGYKTCEMSWILEDNVLMNRSLEALGAKVNKRYRLYEWN